MGVTHKDLHIALGTLLNIMWHLGHKGSLSENGYILYRAESLCCLSETITTLLIGYTPIGN